MKSLLLLIAWAVLLACQPIGLPDPASATLVGEWRVEQIQASQQISPFFSRNSFQASAQPDLLAVTLHFQAGGRCIITTISSQQTGTWQALSGTAMACLQLASTYHLTNIRRCGDVLTFQSTDLTSFLGTATYTLRRQKTF